MKKFLLRLVNTFFLVVIACFTTTFASNDLIYASVGSQNGVIQAGTPGQAMYTITLVTFALGDDGTGSSYMPVLIGSSLPVGASFSFIDGTATYSAGKITVPDAIPGTIIMIYDITLVISNTAATPDGVTSGMMIRFIKQDGNGIESTSFSYEVTAPVPVELTSFSGTVSCNAVSLKWATATEVSNYGFEIERSSSSLSTDWQKIGFVNGSGNSNSPKEYSYTDNNLRSGSYSYRLKQIDNDGSYDYSNIVEIKIGLPTNLELNQNYPNPFNPSTTISFTIPNSGDVSLKIFNALGEEVATLLDGYREAGVYAVNFNAVNLPSGMYIYQMKTNQTLLTKKMSLLK
jgi:hypothetical protein